MTRSEARRYGLEGARLDKFVAEMTPGTPEHDLMVARVKRGGLYKTFKPGRPVGF